MRTKIYAAAFALILAAFAANAQNSNLNRTVQVTNDYAADLSKASMSVFPLTVPDSILRFDHKFDYQGFDKPYMGNEEFNPYLTDLELSGRSDNNKKLYIKAGAGYTPAPVFRGAYTFKNKGKFRMGMRADHNSYFGPWYSHLCSDGYIRPQKDVVKSGYQSYTTAGLDGRVDFERSGLNFNADYEGVHSKYSTPYVAQRDYNGIDAGISYNSISTRKFDFNAKLRASFGWDTVQDYNKIPKKRLSTVIEGNYVGDLFLRFNFSNSHAFELRLDGDFTSGFDKYGYNDYFSGVVVATPAYHFGSERVFLSAGLGMMFAFGDYAGTDLRDTGGNRRMFDLFPTLDFRWKAIDAVLDIVARSSLEGGLCGARRKALDYSFAIDDPTLTIAKTFDANLGIEGRISHYVQYGLKGGWRRIDGAPLFFSDGGAASLYRPGLSMVHDNISDFYGTLVVKARCAGFTADAEVTGRAYMNKSAMPVTPSEWEARLDCRYEFVSRIGIGAGFTYRSEYKAGNYISDGFWDLRAAADYRIDSHWKLFLQGGNLLCADCQWIPTISRRGVCVTGGFVLNF